MKGRSFLPSILVIAVLALGTGCSEGVNTSDPVHGGAVGGLGGGVLGAGTGALVGAMISNGDIGASALLGTAIGVPLGVAAGVYYVYSQQEDEIDRLENEIYSNKQTILQKQAQIDELRRQAVEDSHEIAPDKTLSDHIYTAPSIGNYYR